MLAEASRELAPFIAEPGVRGSSVAPPYDRATLRKRLEVFPALLHLAARAALDNAPAGELPVEGDA